MTRVKTFDSTGISPGGVLFAGDLNNIQDHFADLTNLTQNISAGTLTIGAAGLALSQYASGILRVSGALRVDSVVNAITGFQVNGVALNVSHLSDGVTGTGAIVRANAPVFAGIPTSLTPAPGDNSTKLATTEFVQAAITSLGGGVGSIPSGAMVPFAGVSAPSGWLLCDGSAVSRTTYAALFTAISTLWGAGNGTTTFNVPDMRGRVPVGKDSGTFATLGATGGEEAHTLSVSEIPAHAHTETAVSAGTPTGTISSNSAGTPAGSVTVVAGGAHSHGIHTIQTPGAISDFGFANVIGGSSQMEIATDSAGSHTHTATFSGTVLAAHNHTFAGNALSSHSHVIANTGGGGTHNNLQPYAVTNYIIKT